MRGRESPNESPGFFGGMHAFFGGVGYVVKTPSIWGLALVPALATFLIGTVVIALGVYGAHTWSAGLVEGKEGALWTAGLWLIRILLYAFALLTGLALAFALAQPVSGPALDALARARAKELGFEPSDPSSFWGAIGRSLRVSLTAIVVGVPLILLLTIVEWLFPPGAIVTWPLKLVVSAILATWDLGDYAFSLSGSGVGHRIGWMKAHWSAVLGFGSCAALIAIVPGLGLLMLPFGVAGATQMIAGSGGISTAPRLDAAHPAQLIGDSSRRS